MVEDDVAPGLRIEGADEAARLDDAQAKGVGAGRRPRRALAPRAAKAGGDLEARLGGAGETHAPRRRRAAAAAGRREPPRRAARTRRREAVRS